MELEEKLADPNNFSDAEKLASLATELKGVENKLDEEQNKWEEAMLQLEEFDQFHCLFNVSIK